jgi:hypothetical protein
MSRHDAHHGAAIERRTGLSSARARAKALDHQGSQRTLLKISLNFHDLAQL